MCQFLKSNLPSIFNVYDPCWHGVILFFFLSGFLFTDTDNSRGSKGRKGAIVIPLYHFHELTNTPSWHLIAQRQQWKHQNNVWNLFKVNKNTRTMLMTWFWCLYCQLWIDFTHCSAVFNTDFKRVNAGWAETLICRYASKISTLHSGNPPPPDFRGGIGDFWKSSVRGDWDR